MDKIKAMRLFLHATEVGGMSGADRRFGLSAASVSRQITALEDELVNGRLQRVLNRYDATATDLNTGIHAVYHSKRHLSVKTPLFIDHLVTAFDRLGWWSTGPGQMELSS
jgi:DNA-binding transcriptional LysR family regulator